MCVFVRLFLVDWMGGVGGGGWCWLVGRSVGWLVDDWRTVWGVSRIVSWVWKGVRTVLIGDVASSGELEAVWRKMADVEELSGIAYAVWSVPKV